MVLLICRNTDIPYNKGSGVNWSKLIPSLPLLNFKLSSYKELRGKKKNLNRTNPVT